MSKTTASKPRAETPSWREFVDAAGRSLGSPTEARWIAEEAASNVGVLSREVDTSELGARARREFDRLLKRRLAGEPLQHVLGHWPFRTVDLIVDRRALIPRPETETVVEQALCELERCEGSPLVVDLGTGSGAIACSIASEHPLARVIAVDASEEAVELARLNRDRLADEVARRIEVRIGNWFAALPREVFGHVDVVVSNPPYVAEQEWRGLERVVRDFDPKSALVAGRLGTEAIASVIADTPCALVEGGALVLEISPSQANAARAFAGRAGARSTDVRRDLSGRDRVLVARW